MPLNTHYLIRKLAGRPTCVKHPTTRLFPSARILNAGGPSQRIRIGAYCMVRGELFVFAHGGQIDIGEWCYVGEGTRIWSGGGVTIGNRVLIAHNVSIFDNQTHPLSPQARHEQTKSIYFGGHPADIQLAEKPVHIEDDAWLAAGSTVLRGVRIGQGAVVGAGSMVTEDVAPYTIVSGNPARVIRTISPEELSPADRAARISRGGDLP